ncbi:hypothetical protein [Parvibaculum sp.]|uniref:hypothetical protein n=1 Tax=Parvibaculum sp. TaxID=2024848 RepID=UPI0025F0A043|nr:hypothetical protein [Parvibaculum sp.]
MVSVTPDSGTIVAIVAAAGFEFALQLLLAQKGLLTVQLLGWQMLTLYGLRARRIRLPLKRLRIDRRPSPALQFMLPASFLLGVDLRPPVVGVTIGLLSIQTLLRRLLLALTLAHIQLLTPLCFLTGLLPKFLSLLRLLDRLPALHLHLLPLAFDGVVVLPAFVFPASIPLACSALPAGLLLPLAPVRPRRCIRGRDISEAQQNCQANRCILRVLPHDIRRLPGVGADSALP